MNKIVLIWDEQVVLFEETIADIQYDATNIHVLLEDGTIQSVLKSEWVRNTTLTKISATTKTVIFSFVHRMYFVGEKINRLYVAGR